ncbi:MAG TPA: type II toxin-antitoxin system HicA family toxin [Lacipirellulaceae bacterium]|nr:type II toxin-antitoxin system HicA family toxin [Lacipirellulaceae bacterium]
MKRKDLLKHLRCHGCELLREGRSHSVWVNPANGLQATIPRHREVNAYTARGICRQLSVREP